VTGSPDATDAEVIVPGDQVGGAAGGEPADAIGQAERGGRVVRDRPEGSAVEVVRSLADRIIHR